MSPVGGSPGRRLRGAPDRAPTIEAACSCGRTYTILSSALQTARCKKCKRETRTLPDLASRS